MIFWVTLFIIVGTSDWLIANASTEEEEELAAAVLAIIAMIMLLVYFAR